MTKNFTLLLLLLFAFQAFASGALTPEEKLYTTGKLWGFLKYYHPNVANGKQDWDTELSNIIDKTKTADSKEALSKVYSEWIDQLGTVKICKSCANPSKAEHFDKNFDLSWTENQNLFTTELAAKLKFIEANRFQGKSHYFSRHSGVNNVKIENETSDKNSDWSNENFRLLSLFRYWNQIEYFFPYKYMTDQKWDDVLAEMIPKFTHARTEQEFHLAMLELVIKVDDSHANLVTPLTNAYFGFKWAPVEFKIIDEKLIVIGFYDDAAAAKDDLKIGDVIENIDGQTISEIIKKQYKYIHGSNYPTKMRDMYYAVLNGATDSVEITFTRNGVTSNKTIHRDFIKNYKKAANPNKKAWKISPDNIGYIDMGELKFDRKAVESMMDSLKNTKAIIFDIRNYPNGTMYLIARSLFPQRKDFVKFTEPVPNYPGKFMWSKTLSAGKSNNKEYYKGKVVILVNEETQSHAEFTTMCLQQAPNAITIGSQTSGADGNVSTLEFPNGSKTYMTGLGVFYPDGTETQRKGIKVDIEVKPTILGIQQGKDEVLEKALEIAKQ